MERENAMTEAEEQVEAEEPGLSEDTASLPVPPGALLTDRVLLAVRQARARQDQKHGILRDYRDGTAGTRFHGPSISIDKSNVGEAKRALADAEKAGRRSWRNYLELAVAEAVAESNERRLQQRLIEVAAVACAWVEGIDVRADDNRIAIEQKAMQVRNGRIIPMRPPWWKRLLKLFVFG
jgi:hypothetical protein